jgi:hypothetical protein
VSLFLLAEIMFPKLCTFPQPSDVGFRWMLKKGMKSAQTLPVEQMRAECENFCFIADHCDYGKMVLMSALSRVHSPYSHQFSIRFSAQLFRMRFDSEFPNGWAIRLANEDSGWRIHPDEFCHLEVLTKDATQSIRRDTRTNDKEKLATFTTENFTISTKTPLDVPSSIMRL